MHSSAREARSQFSPKTDCRPCGKEPASGDLHQAREYVEVGGLMTYGASFTD